uniref:Gypsy retrotransposon integrase-like protein 1 n=1 Tax=Astyanax mexicanus TaxID=7994 RepID=A0A3B1KCG7_ASTMX
MRINNKAAHATCHEQLPHRLVGTKCTSQVTIDGQSYSCLLDTGSQVTTIPQSFHETHLPHVECKPLNDLLEVEAANGQPVPYSGYIELNITFPKEFLGISIEVPTLALVVSDTHGSAQSLLLIGTNTLDALYESYCNENPAKCQTQHHGYKTVLRTLGVRHKQTEDSMVGNVRLHSDVPKVIPARQSSVLEGSVTAKGPEKQFVLQQPTTSLPGGLIVTSSLLTLPSKPHTKLPVILKNESDHDVILMPKRVIAELHAVQQIMPSAAFPKSSAPNPQPPVPASGMQFDFADSPIPAEWKERVIHKLNTMPEVFAQHDLDFGHSSKVKHHIKLSDETPFKQRARPIHPQDINAVRLHLEELLEAGVIRESESSFSSPIVVVRKKNGDVRLCVDYRKLNLQTVKDAYALPNLEETFSVLTGSQWFSVLDLKSGYYQIELEEADKHKTAFVCPMGFWEFNRLPQGITNAPSTFQRLMEKCMSDLHLKEVIVFLDDLIIFSATLEEHEHRLLRVLQRLKEYGLKLSPEKCKFFQTSVRYLGHIVSRNGVETDPEKIQSLKNWPNPKNLKELRSFLGFAGYYRRFIQDYSKIVKPLNDLTAGYGPIRKKCKVNNDNTHYYKPKEPFGNRWTDSCQEAFNTIISKLTSAPVLAYANSQLPYILHTDASTTGLGAALYQEQDGQIRAIAFASRGLSRSESRYPAHKLEFLALKWAVTEKFSDYLYGNSFTVITDSNPLTYILTSAKLDATSYRWLSALSTFSFKLQYRPGKHNLDADALSRRPHDTELDDPTSQKEQDRIRQFTLQHLPEFDNDTRVGPEVVQAICEARLVRQPSDSASESSSVPLVESLAAHPDSMPDGFVQGEHFDGFPVISKVSKEEVREKQRSDSVIREVISSLEGGGVPSPSVKREIPHLSLMCREWNRLLLINGILYRKRQEGPEVQYQLVLPEEWRETVMTSLHDDMGHLGIECTLDLVRSRFYWPRMAVEVDQKIKTCRQCVLRKAPLEKAAPLVNIRASRPLELVCMDFLSIEPDRSNTKDVLVITDFFTKYAVAVPTPNQKARTVAKCLWENFIVHYGIPERLHSDQGPDFESKTIKELCEVIGTRKVRTSPYHPRGNPVERFNRTLLSMLGTLKGEQKSHWRDFVKPLVHAYNCTKHESTGYTPYELMFGRKPRLPIDLAFDVSLSQQKGTSHSQYVKHLKTQLEESYKLAMGNAAKMAEKNKTRFDKKVTESILDKDDRVLVRNVKLRGKHKLADKWESTVHVVVQRAGELPVYTVRPENKEGPLRTLHRDLLRPCNFLSVAEEDSPKAKVRRPRTRTVLHKSDSEESEPGSDSDDNPVYYYTGSLRPEPVEVIRIHESKDLVSIPVPEVQPKLIASQPIPDFCAEDSHEKNPEHSPEINSGYSPEKIPENLPERTEVDAYLPVSDQTATQDTLELIESVERVEENDEVQQQFMNASEDSETEIPVRHSTRRREKAKRLTYPELGNPLVSIVQSLFQGLSTALTQSLMETPYVDPSQPARNAPSSHAQGRAYSLRREGVTQV